MELLLIMSISLNMLIAYLKNLEIDKKDEEIKASLKRIEELRARIKKLTSETTTLTNGRKIIARIRVKK